MKNFARIFVVPVAALGCAFALGCALALGLTACSNADPKLVLPARPVPAKPGPAPTSAVGRVTSEKGPVDILFVIDDSRSMGAHQQQLSANVGLFVQQFAGASLDYHIGVTTSSTSLEVDWGQSFPWGDGKLMGTTTVIDRNTPNGLSLLQNNMIVGIGGNGHERFFVPVKQALTEPNLSGPNAGFYRPDATLAIVMITDATDPGTVLSTADFEQFLSGLKPGHPEKVLSYAVIIPSSLGPSPFNCDRDPDGPPYTIEQFLADVHGQSFSLCDPNFGQKLADMGKDIASKVTGGQIVLLGRKPIVSSIKVSFGTQVIPYDSESGWLYDPVRLAILFGPKVVWSAQPLGTQVSVVFTPENVLPN